MPEINSDAGLDRHQVKYCPLCILGLGLADEKRDAPQGLGILIGFCYHPDQDNQAEYAVFGTLDMKGQLVPVMRHGYRAGDDIRLCHTKLNKRIDFNHITFEKHLVCLKRDIGALTEYCRICIKHIDQKEPLNSLVAVGEAKKAMAGKKLDGMERDTSPFAIEDKQTYAKGLEDIKGPAPRAEERKHSIPEDFKLETQHSSFSSTSTATSECKLARLDQFIEEAEKELGWKLSSARPYVGIQTEGTIGTLLPVATNGVLKQWTDFFRGKGWTEEEIKEAGYAMDSSAYVKLPIR